MRLKCNLRLPAALLALEMVMRHNSLTQVTCDVETVSKHQLQTRLPALTATHAAVRTLCHNSKCDETQKPNVVKEPQTPVYSRTVIQKKKNKKTKHWKYRETNCGSQRHLQFLLKLTQLIGQRLL